MTRRTTALLGAALLGLAACVDLNEDLISGLANQPYPTPDVFQALVNATYEPLRSFYAQERGFTLTEFGTDIYTEGADGSYKYVNEYTAQLNPDVDFIRDTWADFYRAINTANTAIAQAPAVQMDSSLKAQRLAEARFLRALRSEEHTSELQSQSKLVCRLLLEKKNNHEAIRPLRDGKETMSGRGLRIRESFVVTLAPPRDSVYAPQRFQLAVTLITPTVIAPFV